MRSILFFTVIVAVQTSTFCQSLSFSELGSDPAYCRLFSYQSGNGTVYAAVTGGTPDYTYQWTNLQSGSSHTGGLWGGLNPGLYKITVTDDVGAVLIDTVEVDSINPVANFGEILGNLNPAPFGYTGFIYEDAQFVNLSTGYANPNDPNADTTFFWNTGLDDPWEISHDISYGPALGYGVGDYDVCLVTLNKNGCADTICKQIHIFGPVGIETNEQQYLSLYSAPDQNLVYLNSNGFDESISVKIYTVSGEEVLTFETADQHTEIAFNVARGVYVYTIYGAQTQQVLATGKLNH